MGGTMGLKIKHPHVIWSSQLTHFSFPVFQHCQGISQPLSYRRGSTPKCCSRTVQLRCYFRRHSLSGRTSCSAHSRSTGLDCMFCLVGFHRLYCTLCYIMFVCVCVSCMCMYYKGCVQGWTCVYKNFSKVYLIHPTNHKSIAGGGHPNAYHSGIHIWVM